MASLLVFVYEVQRKHSLSCVHCKYVAHGRWAWRVRNRMKTHRVNVHFGWKE